MKTRLMGWTCVVLLAGCGPGARLGGGKDGAAHALAQASCALTRVPTSSGVDLMNLGLTVEVKGARSGSAVITYKTLASSKSGAVESSVSYRSYSEDGRTYYNGNVAVKSGASIGPTLLGAEIVMAGRLKLTGEVQDFIEVDVTERLELADETQPGGPVSLQLSGSIGTTDASYDYGGEQLAFDVSATLPLQARE
jgi:hypothetical protein